VDFFINKNAKAFLQEQFKLWSYQYFWEGTPRLSGTPLQEGNYEVEFEDGTKVNTKDLEYKLIKPLIWWE